MKKRVFLFLATYLLFVLLFVLQKPFFMGYYHHLYREASLTDYLQVMYHGLPLDLSLAGYLTVIPGFLLIASVWTRSHRLRRIGLTYFGVVAFIMAAVFIIDLALYDFWDFRLDATPLFYFLSSPKDSLAGVGTGFLIKGAIAILLYALLLYVVFRTVLFRASLTKLPYPPMPVTLTLLLLTVALFLPIRGGLSVSTMNLSKVYFSQQKRLNHAAINPAFSFMYSITHQNDFDRQYRFMASEQAENLFETLTDRTIAPADTTPKLLNTTRPNIVFLILESFSTHLMEHFGGTPVAANLDSLANEGVLFTNMYANSFRTDRGLASIISAYPAQPGTSIMKYAEKTENLPSIPRSLKSLGYTPTYYYGGDADFTNMRSYLVSAGIERIISEKDFSQSERSGKWGVHDHLLMRRLLNDMKQTPPKEPFITFVQTSSSHEPFEVPYRKLGDKVLNAFAYTDSCVGDFLRELRGMPQWANTLVVIVPDHWGCYPRPLDNPLQRHTIPLLFVGGAVKEARKIDTYASQIDIAATLLAQMGLSHKEFVFSKNILNPDAPHFAFFTEPSLFGMVTAENQLVYNLDAQATEMDEGRAKGQNLEAGKAYLQKLYDDLARR